MSDRSATAVSEREQRILGIIETARAKRAKFRDTQINMAHGAGGKATAALIEGLLLPAFGGEALAELADAGAVTAGDVELAMTTDSYRRTAAAVPRRLDRRAGGQRHRQ